MKKYSTKFLFLLIGLMLGFIFGKLETFSAYASPGLQGNDPCSNIEAISDVNEILKCLIKLELENSDKLDTLLTKQAQSQETITISQFLDSDEPLPEPIELTGTGPSVMDLDKGNYPAIAIIEGGTSGSVFSVTGHSPDSDLPNPIVATFDSYSGIRPLDVDGDSPTSRLEIEAKGDWTITILPITEAEVFNVPGTFEGEGDTVLILKGTPDTAIISGNKDGGNVFSITGHGGRFPDPMVATFDPYEGEVIVDPETILLEIQATGPWSITVK